MSIRKFEENDIFLNVMRTQPHFKFSIYNGQIHYKKNFGQNVPTGFAGVFDLNLDPPGLEAISLENMLDFSNPDNSMYLPLI
jgi:hypothetical protein